MESLTEPVEELLNCPVCFEKYSSPKIFPCVHSLCLSCINKIIAKSEPNTKAIKCPFCRKDVPIPEGGAEHLKTNIYIQNLLEVWQAKQTTNAKCKFCYENDDETAEAVAKCMNCDEYLCFTCSEIHTRTRMTRAHRVVTLSQLESGEFDSFIRAEQGTATCGSHKKERLKIFCESCDILVCQMCVFLEHKGHAFTDLKIASKRKCAEMKKELQEMHLQMDKLDNQKAEVDALQNGVKKDREHQLAVLDKTEEDVIIRIRQQVKTTKVQLEEKFRQSLQQLSALREEICSRRTSMQTSISLIQNVTKQGNCVEILTLHPTFTSNLKTNKTQKDICTHPNVSIPTLNVSKEEDIFRKDIFTFGETRDITKLYVSSSCKKDNKSKDKIRSDFASSFLDGEHEVQDCMVKSDEESITQQDETKTPETKLTSKQITSERTEADCKSIGFKYEHSFDITTKKSKSCSKYTSCCCLQNNRIAIVDNANSTLFVYNEKGVKERQFQCRRGCCVAGIQDSIICAAMYGAEVMHLPNDVKVPVKHMPVSKRSCGPVASVKAQHFAMFEGDSIVFVNLQGEKMKQVSHEADDQGNKLLPTFLVHDSMGNMVMSCWNESDIYIFSPDGSFRKRLQVCGRGTKYLAADTHGSVFVLNSTEIAVISPKGELSHSASLKGSIRDVRCIACSTDGKLFVVNTVGRVVVFKLFTYDS